MSLTLPMPSQRGHMPPVYTSFSMTVRSPVAVVRTPLVSLVGMLNENAPGPPMCGSPMRLNRMRSIAFASVAVPTVERTFAPMRS